MVLQSANMAADMNQPEIVITKRREKCYNTTHVFVCERTIEHEAANLGILDSGFTQHLSGNRNALSEYELLKPGKKSNVMLGEHTERCCPQQNGLLERLNRTVVEKTRWMPIGAGLISRLWHFAHQYAPTVYNERPTSVLH